METQCVFTNIQLMVIIFNIITITLMPLAIYKFKKVSYYNNNEQKKTSYAALRDTLIILILVSIAAICVSLVFSLMPGLMVPKTILNEKTLNLTIYVGAIISGVYFIAWVIISTLMLLLHQIVKKQKTPIGK